MKTAIAADECERHGQSGEGQDDVPEGSYIAPVGLRTVVMSAARKARIPSGEREDVVQDVSIKLAAHVAATGLGSDELRALAFHACRNCWRSRLRRQSTRLERESCSVELRSEQIVDPERLLDARRTLDGLVDVMERLPAELRDLMMLYYSDGLSASEVASQLHVREGTIRSRLRRLGQALKYKLANLEFSPEVEAALRCALHIYRAAAMRKEGE